MNIKRLLMAPELSLRETDPYVMLKQARDGFRGVVVILAITVSAMIATAAFVVLYAKNASSAGMMTFAVSGFAASAAVACLGLLSSFLALGSYAAYFAVVANELQKQPGS